MDGNFFPTRPDAHPMIYAYEDTNPQYQGLLKVGYTAVDVDQRVAQQYPTKRPDGSIPYHIVYRESAMYPDGTSFTDHDVHKVLKRNHKAMGGEWFRCTVEEVRAAVLAVKNHMTNAENRTNDFKMRPEQKAAVEKTEAYFRREGAAHYPKFLWNCKMRFGKTFAAYELAKSMGFKRILVLTFKPAVASAWQEDLESHIDFEGWQFISGDTDLTYETADKKRPIVCFGSFQDYLGVGKDGGIKAKNEWVHETNWDMVIFDEYHFGAWRNNAKQLFAGEDEDAYDTTDVENYDRGNALNETWLPITSDYYLYLSGTPFRALNSGEFIEDEIYSWTYSDEQRAKAEWKGENNPYAALPRMVMMTYKIPESIRRIAQQGEYDEFDLNEFFAAKGKGDQAKFIHEAEVQKWLDLIRGSYMETRVDDLKLGNKKPAMPYSDIRLLNVLQHTLWFLPNVASCYAMGNLLKQRQNVFYHDYHINVCAGTKAGVGIKALEPVKKSMQDPLESKTITLSCGKLTTGVTVKPWTGIFMLRKLSTPETYFQAAFRVQSPWEITVDGGKKEIIKKECYVFDFALDRALKQIVDYGCRLDIEESNPEKKVADFIHFLPVLAYDGSQMQQVNAASILDIAMAGTSATLLARRWESALLVNVDNDTLSRLLANPAAMEALMKIEGFRALNKDGNVLETIINKSDAVKKAKKEGTENLSKKEKKELSEEEKEYKSKRKEVQEKLIKFATRIPIFMYLTDYREYSLKDVITQLEPQLFQRVTGLEVKDFELLVSLGVFNDQLMNEAVYKFRRYEESSLSYTGINRHEGEAYGVWDTVISPEDYKTLWKVQQDSMNAPVVPFVVRAEEPTHLQSQIKKDMGRPKRGQSVQILHKGSTTIFPDGKSWKRAAPKIVEQKPKVIIDLSGIKVGCKVHHKAFGDGIVKNVRSEYITIAFATEEKTFQYPGAFSQGFLSIIK